jgi:DNA-binding response OmpR family regulator
MTGLDLATTMTAERPQLRVLIMAGFPEQMLTFRKEWHFLAKPFAVRQLSARIRALIAPLKGI